MVTAALAGCASLVGVQTLPSMLPATWEARREMLQSWGRFDSYGRVAIARDGEGFSGSWRWAQRAQRSTLELDGPLGVGGLRLDFDSEGIVDEAARLALEQQLGFVLPVESLRYWMLGVPDPREVVEERVAADSARLDSLRQKGWTVTFKNYAPVSGADYELPQRIEVDRESLRVRLVIEGWSGGGQ
jgi:outer membrane lipoprotein LolB